MLKINRDNVSFPVYRQIADSIKFLIAKGDMPEGTTLPPVRQLSHRFGVSQGTIAQAYHQLKREGLLDIRHGAGATVISKKSLRKSKDEPRLAVRRVLVLLVLAGMTKTEIQRLVADELAGLRT